jgi:hypothetical protein
VGGATLQENSKSTMIKTVVDKNNDRVYLCPSRYTIFL